ncbi:arginine--tRNA ligase [Roseospira marina]|uniref:Arginine--tRNA ligase n=1 Tax=Roseospira marina TaxID=140057 RepID=A0A5M6IF29_9PROT|nr:arginine--tRNA ligase [Roseospira marina]KAA5606896.1 arginine--tRNA ligase [Roseospira marina]MBB4312933.1 arginyl-tRNA synthetase [Roseospira marina]MBB5086294.1 arginyl-tRNA synthetase [Roseospira marina]
MNIFTAYKDIVLAQVAALVEEGVLPGAPDVSRVTVEPPRDPAHGDMATNAAMVLAKPAGLKPRDLAERLAAKLGKAAGVVEATVAGPGFINLRLARAIWLDCLRDCLSAGRAYGDSRMGDRRRVNVEFVSANPTGPMHVGHARGAVVGDALAALLEKAGYRVTREYYINDAGSQVDALARAVHARYRQALGRLSDEDIAGMLARKELEYGGDYLVPAGQALADRFGDTYADAPEAEWLAPVRDAAVDMMLDMIRDDLQALGVVFDVFSSERALVQAGRVDSTLAWLDEQGLIYTGVLEPPKGKAPEDWEARPQTLFRATDFGDDVDRPVRKSDGAWTYFAGDMAYHRDKVERGFNDLINVLGADHGGYVKRLQAVVKAVSGGQATLDVKLCQLVKLLDNGEPVKMSKRAGTFVTLRDVVDRVGKDVVRFIMLTRKNDAALDFDFAKVTEQSRDNPVWYVQYAHARACSVLRHAGEMFPGRDLSPAALAGGALERLEAPEELEVVRVLASWPRLIESAAEAHEPHRVAYYLADVAAAFHGLWTRGKDDTELRFLVPDDERLSLARLALVQGVATVLASGLHVFGVQPVEELR